jgi:coenzyme PQQ precursor peptide PqqA
MHGSSENCRIAPLRCASYIRGNSLEAVNEEETMTWATPTLTEICIGLEINGYLPAEF